MKMRVSGKCKPKNLAGAIAGFFGENRNGILELDCIGAAAVNCAVKGVAISSAIMNGKRVDMFPRFEMKRNVLWRNDSTEEVKEPLTRDVTGIVFEVKMIGCDEANEENIPMQPDVPNDREA